MKLGGIYLGDTCIVPRVWRASAWWDRARGLLGRRALGEGEGLLLEPCGSVHTFWMRYPIDLVFLDAQDRLLRTCASVPPWRARAARGASKTLELPAGALRALVLNPGDPCIWRAS
ncbi:DUF192 domain-containing protein [Luteibacter yeojuensis]|uniref:DUF192 domain-containing protein n=1 Tax=Luteibacter yeojuensis TaxID=345309 RepID=A0A7X5TMK6_9GAMM|nr:DUF192 domain-containing protein [Luteibacter yeojuensis]